jgi:hypothetical protein
MNTIKILSIAFAAAISLAACGGDDEPDSPTPTPNPPTPETPDTPPTGKHLTMTCDMPADASEITVSLKGLTDEVTSQTGTAPWLTTTLTAYTTGTPQVTVACQQNLTTAVRTQDVTFLAHSQASTAKYAVNDTLVLTVRQAVYSDGGSYVDDPNGTVTDQPAFSRR